MIRRYILDTNTASYILKGKSIKAKHRLGNLKAGEVVCVSVITEAELRFGLARRPLATTQQLLLEQFLNTAEILPWGREEAASYATLRARQEAAGKSISPFDLLIAAHAMTVGAVLVTNDEAFHHIPGLPGIESWAADL